MKPASWCIRSAKLVIAVPLASIAPAFGEEAAEEEPILQEVVVTGSRIAAPNLTSTSPIQVVDSREIQQTGKNDVSDILFRLPQNFNNSLGQDFSNNTSGLSAAGGLSTADLRGLGPNRTLVLINGRRLGVGDPNTAIASPAPDLDQIPVALIDRVDVVTGGASAVYGSDAIAGVVNFIMKKDFEGLQLDYQTGWNWHHNGNSYAQAMTSAGGVPAPRGDIWDGYNRNFNITVGQNFAEGKGNVTAYAGYLQANPVYSGARDFGACQLDAISDTEGGPITGTGCSGSGNSNRFTPLGTTLDGVFTQAAGARYAVVGNEFLPWPADGQSPPAIFNSQPYISIARDDRRYTGGFMAHYKFADYAEPYAEFGFMNDKTHTEIAPSALFEDSNPLDANLNYATNCSNPLLSAQQQAVLGCTPALIAADAANPGSALANVRIGRRNIEGGPRSADYEHTNYRAVFGSRGIFADAWNYDVYGSYYYTTFFNSNGGFLNFQSINDALLVTTDPDTGAPVCISGSTCTPYNIWKSGAVTPDQLAPMYLLGTAYGSVTERILHADVTGELGQYGIKLPTARDGIAINVGWEHRSDKTEFQPDSGELSGLLSGFGGASVPINNGITVKEEFVEVRIPLVQDMVGAQDLVADGGYRHSNYSTTGGVNTYKFELQWAPLHDVRLRASYQRAIRAPSIIELYNPQLVGQIAIGEDPCAPAEATGVAAATLEQCLRTGATAAQYGNGISPSIPGGTNTIPQGTASQLTQLIGGNIELQPEIGDTFTVGMNLTPEALPTFNASVDYWHIDLKDEVGTYPASAILSNCLQNGDPTFCSQLVRSPATGGLLGASPESGGYIVQTNQNLGGDVISGIDLGANYRLELPEALGSIGFALNGSYMIQNDLTPYSGAHTYDCSGLFGATCQTLNPRWRHTLRTTWATPWNVDVSLLWRYIGSMSLDNNSQDPTLHFAEFGVADDFNARLPAVNYLDLMALWSPYKGIQIRGGINNILDKDPPIVTSEITAGGAANTYETYDTLGRQLFVGVTAKF